VCACVCQTTNENVNNATFIKTKFVYLGNMFPYNYPYICQFKDLDPSKRNKLLKIISTIFLQSYTFQGNKKNSPIYLILLVFHVADNVVALVKYVL